MRYDLNKVILTQEEQNCILLLLEEASQCGYPSSNEPFYPIIHNIMTKYYDTDDWEGQPVF